MVKKINTNWYCNLLALLKLSYILQTDYIYITYTKKLIFLLNILVKINYISNYKILSNNTLIIYLFYKNNKLNYNNLKIFYKSSKFYYFSFKLLKKFFYNDYKKILVLSTSKGILIHSEAINLKCGGKLLFLLY